MTPSELETRGRLLYGLQWQSELSRSLKVHNVTIFRWMTGTKIPPSKEEQIKILLENRARLINATLINIYREKFKKCNNYAA